MNCKPGDLAYLSSDCTSEGLVVEVLSEAVNPGSDLPAWNCKSRTPVNCQWQRSGKLESRTEFICEDQYLRPITGVLVHDEQHDEVKA